MKRAAILFVMLMASLAYAVDPLPLTPQPVDPSEALSGMSQAIGEGEQANVDGAMGAMNAATQWGSYGVNVVNATADFIDAYHALTDPDANCMDLGTAGAPEVPTSCADSEACGQCFTDAQRKLNGMRVNLERLRCVYRAASDFTQAAISFGDNASGIHAVTGLAWQSERAGIIEAFEHLKHSYDEKYQQMLPNLRGALEAIGQCEAQHFQNRDWYSRFGFMYYTFMADRYKRSD